MRYRKKPVVIEAKRFTGDNYGAIFNWAQALSDDPPPMSGSGNSSHPTLTIHTLEGLMVADSGDWIICGIKREFYPCKPDIFAATYEPAEEPTR